MRARLCAFMLCASVLLAVPAGTAAKPGCQGRTVSPHGNSEADQYSETIPGACGNHRPNAGNPAASPNGTVPSQTLRRLESLGPGGQTAAALAQANAPAGARRAEGGRGGTDDNPPSAGDTGEDGGALSGVGRALGGSSGDGEGMGIALPLVLAGTLVAALAYWLMRRRAGPAG